MAPHLLCLPTEIRYIIYEYALTEEEEVIYREDEIGIGRIFGCKSIPLSYRDGLHSEHYARFTFFPTPNQLQSVCRQLYHETSGLTLKYNTIVFSELGVSNNGHSIDRNSIDRCARFLRRTTPQQQDSIRLHVKDCGCRQPSHMVSLPTLFRFCETHPKSRIDLHLVTNEQNHPWGYFEAAHLLHTIFRKESLRFLFQHNPEECLSCRCAYRYWPTVLLREDIVVPANFRVFPRVTKFHEDSFRSEAKKWTSYASVDRNSFEDFVDVDAFVAWARDWYENGM